MWGLLFGHKHHFLLKYHERDLNQHHLFSLKSQESRKRQRRSGSQISPPKLKIAMINHNYMMLYGISKLLNPIWNWFCCICPTVEVLLIVRGLPFFFRKHARVLVCLFSFVLNKTPRSSNNYFFKVFAFKSLKVNVRRATASGTT